MYKRVQVILSNTMIMSKSKRMPLVFDFVCSTLTAALALQLP